MLVMETYETVPKEVEMERYQYFQMYQVLQTSDRDNAAKSR